MYIYYIVLCALLLSMFVPAFADSTEIKPPLNLTLPAPNGYILATGWAKAPGASCGYGCYVWLAITPPGGEKCKDNTFPYIYASITGISIMQSTDRVTYFNFSPYLGGNPGRYYSASYNNGQYVAVIGQNIAKWQPNDILSPALDLSWILMCLPSRSDFPSYQQSVPF